MSNRSKLDKLKNIIAILEGENSMLKAESSDLKYYDNALSNAIISDLCTENKKLKDALLKIGENRYYYLNVDDEDYSFYDFTNYIKEIIEGAGIKIDVP